MFKRFSFTYMMVFCHCLVVVVSIIQLLVFGVTFLITAVIFLGLMLVMLLLSLIMMPLRLLGSSDKVMLDTWKHFSDVMSSFAYFRAHGRFRRMFNLMYRSGMLYLLQKPYVRVMDMDNHTEPQQLKTDTSAYQYIFVFDRALSEICEYAEKNGEYRQRLAQMVAEAHQNQSGNSGNNSNGNTSAGRF